MPAALSRQKALARLKDYEDVHGGMLVAVPSSMATDYLYRMFMKIGATKELPPDEKETEMYLNDFWIDLYLRNHLCPGDIPFPIIIKEFTTAMVQRKVIRKGNNQEAICEAFNEWVTRDKVRHELYAIRDRMFPSKKPKQIAEESKKPSYNRPKDLIDDLSKQEVVEALESYKQVKGIVDGISGMGSYGLKLERTLKWIEENEQ